STETSPAIAHTFYQYDGAGRLTETRVSGPAGSALTLERLQHDGEGNRTSVTRVGDGGTTGERTWTYGYDLNGDVDIETDPDGRTTRFVRDPLGRIKDEFADAKLSSDAATAADLAVNLGIGHIHYDWDTLGEGPSMANQITRLAGVEFKNQPRGAAELT